MYIYIYTWYNYYCTNYCPSHLTCPCVQLFPGIDLGPRNFDFPGLVSQVVRDDPGQGRTLQMLPVWGGPATKAGNATLPSVLGKESYGKLRWPENLRGVCFTLVMIYIRYWYSYVLCNRISLEKTNRTLDSGCVWSWSWKASTRPDHQCLQESPCTIVHNVIICSYSKGFT